MPVRSASARWEGTLQEGKGTMRLATGAFEGAYSFGTRMQEEKGTNPEELIGAAHAACYSMALSKGLADAGFTPEAIDTTATVHLDRVDGKQTVTRIDLVTTASAPGIDDTDFQKVAEATKEGCPISRLLAPGVEITLSASLA